MSELPRPGELELLLSLLGRYASATARYSQAHGSRR